jgi:hypothetical protein
MLPGHGVPEGVRGRFRTPLAPDEREAFLRRASTDMVREVSTYALEQVRSLEAALFTFFMLSRNEPVQTAARHAAALLDRSEAGIAEEAFGELGVGDPVRRDLLVRLQNLVGERSWLMGPRDEGDDDAGALNPVMERLDAIYREAKEVRIRVETLVQEHLLASGLSAGEVEREADRTAKLWRAA